MSEHHEVLGLLLLLVGGTGVGIDPALRSAELLLFSVGFARL